MAADTCRARSALPLPPQLPLLSFSATFAARAAPGLQGGIGGGGGGLVSRVEGCGFALKGSCGLSFQ